MNAGTPTIEFYEGIGEEISDVSLRRHRSTGMRTVKLTFRHLRSIEQFNSFKNRFTNALRLTDEEGVITVEPSSVKFFFAGPEGDEFERMECQFEVEQEDHWQRFMRFMQRYAAANGMEYGENPTP